MSRLEKAAVGPELEQETVVAVRDVSFSFGETSVLADVTLEIDGGDFVCIVGPNGGGKTTLVRLILGLLKPDRGRIEVLGMGPEAALPHVGYVPQHFQFDMSFPVRVQDVVLMGCLVEHRWFGFYSKTDREAARRALDHVGLEDLENRPFAALSGGQRQRVLIARALVSQPKVLILDEPMANIDPAVQDELYALLRELSKQTTILMVTHDIGFVSAMFNRVVCVNRAVWMHPTSDLTGDTIRNLYGNDVRMVRHDHKCSEKGHEWSSF